MTLSFVSSNTLAVLLDVSLKATVVLGLALLATRLLRRRSAALRHLVLVLALGAICALPFVERALPKLPTPGLAKVMPAAPPDVAQVKVAAPAQPAQVETYVETRNTTPAATKPGKQVNVHNETTWTGSVQEPVEPTSTQVTVVPTTEPTPVPSRWPLYLVGLWLAGVALLSLRVFAGMLRLRRVLRSAAHETDAAWNHALRSATSALGIARPVTLLRSGDVDVPLTTGTIYPVVVLPLEASEWTPARRTAVLHHELAHVKRLDALTQLLAQAALALHWFNPLAWLAVRQMRLEREKACDDFVLATGARASEYAHDLLEIVTQLGSKREYAVALAMARKSQFEGRLLALLDPRRNRRALSRAAVVVTAIAAAALVLPLAAMSPQDAPVPPAPPAPAVAATPAARPAPAAMPADPSQPVVAETPEAPEAQAQPTPPPDENTLVYGDTPEARPAEGPTPRPAVAPEARHGSGQGYGYGYGSPPQPAIAAVQSGMPAVPAIPGIPAAPAVPAVMGGGGFPGSDCKDTSKETHVSISNNTDDSGYQTMSGSWVKGQCTLRVHSAGKLAFSADGMQLTGIGSDDGFFEVNESISGSSRRVRVTPAAGSLKYEYWRNGQSQEFDAAARQWFSRFLLEFERHTGFAAATRVPLLLKQGGPNALLNEVSQIDSDYVAALYLRTMVETTQLDAATLRRTLDQAGRQLKSDYEKARILMAIAAKYPLTDDASRAALLAGADSLKSDYEHARVLIEFLKRANLSKEQVRASLASAAKLKSDYERARVLMTMLDQRMIDASMQEVFFNAADGLKSDYEHSRTLIGLLEHVPLNQQIVTRLIQATATIQSDYERARVLTAAAGKYPVSGQAKAAYLQAANGIKSEYERNRALAALTSSTRM